MRCARTGVRRGNVHIRLVRRGGAVFTCHDAALVAHAQLQTRNIEFIGRDFTLLASQSADTTAWEAAALSLGLPMLVLRSSQADVAALYTTELVLIRPDHHIAWRGAASSDAAHVLARAIGRSDTGAPTQAGAARREAAPEAATL